MIVRTIPINNQQGTMVPADKVWIVTDVAATGNIKYKVTNGVTFMAPRETAGESNIQNPMYCSPGDVIKHYDAPNNTGLMTSATVVELDYTGVPVVLTQPFYDTNTYTNGFSGTNVIYDNVSIRVSTFAPVDFEATSVDIAIDNDSLTHGDVNIYTTSDNRQEVSFALVKPDDFIGEVKTTLTINTNKDESYVIDIFRTFTEDYYASVDELNYEATIPVGSSPEVDVTIDEIVYLAKSEGWAQWTIDVTPEDGYLVGSAWVTQSAVGVQQGFSQVHARININFNSTSSYEDGKHKIATATLTRVYSGDVYWTKDIPVYLTIKRK